MAIDGQELPGAGHATQFDAAAVLEPRARAGDHVTDGAGDEVSPAAAWRESALRCALHSSMSEFSGFALADVDARADLNA